MNKPELLDIRRAVLDALALRVEKTAQSVTERLQAAAELLHDGTYQRRERADLLPSRASIQDRFSAP